MHNHPNISSVHTFSTESHKSTGYISDYDWIVLSIFLNKSNLKALCDDWQFINNIHENPKSLKSVSFHMVCDPNLSKYFVMTTLIEYQI